MNCPRCGEICRCHSGPPVAESPQRPDAGDQVPATSSGLPCEGDVSAWRDELSVRLSRYRERRRVRPPRYPSLTLPFALAENVASAADLGSSRAGFEPMSDQSLALDGMMAKSVEEPLTGDLPADAAVQAAGYPSTSSRAKILEFPRFIWEPPVPPPDQLAEPVSDRPRILEVPEVAPPPPALGGISIETAEREEAERQPGIDVPLQSASLARRMLASAIDLLIIAVASAVFWLIFGKVARVRPPRIQILSLAAGIPCLLWAAYQYLLIVYAATTPGLRATGLELVRFDGAAANRSLRRWRVLASYLSAVSLGLGYIWVFLDEDVLCWHDRITRTYLAPKQRGAGYGKS
jgi:uncharacterized RDD family membrane protein YckC